MLEQVRFRERTMLKLGLGCSLTYLVLVDTSTDGIKRTRVRMIYMCSWRARGIHTWKQTHLHLHLQQQQRRSSLVTSAALNAVFKSEDR